MANRRFQQFQYSLIKYPVYLTCNFVVDSTNGNGLGIRSLKGPGIQNVFMHTTVAPAAGNPNPGTGVIMVQFQDCYQMYLGGYSGQVSPLSGTPLTSTTNHLSYVIVSLGTTTLAQWQAAGVPVGIVPAVGTAFVAIATGAIGGTGAVEVIATTGSGIDHIEAIGDINKTLVSQAGSQAIKLGVQCGAYGLFQCFLGNAQAAPADGTVIGMSFMMSNSSITTQGE